MDNSSPNPDPDPNQSSDKKNSGKAENVTNDDKLSQKDLLRMLCSSSMAEKVDPKDKEFKFWQTQPVPKLDEKPSQHGPIEEKTVDQVQKEPYNLPETFEWSDCDLHDEKTLDEVYTLLNQNYVEDDDSMFRFDYSREFLFWALHPPGYLPQLHVGVRTKTKTAVKGKLVGFITGIPAHIRVYSSDVPMVEINFLCVHKKLRSKRLAPVLIKEITRRVNLTGVWQAVYTAGVVLPKPVARNRYFHRSLNPKKLLDIGFSRLHRHMTVNRTIKLYKLPPKPQTPGIRAMTNSDTPQAHALLVAYLKKFSLTQIFSLDEFKHWLLPRKDVVFSYVVEDRDHKITDMVSFYCLPSTVIGNLNHKSLRAAYSFYNVSTKTPWSSLMLDALIFAKLEGFDVFNALNVMENESFLEDLKFGPGDGCLQYYLYNWRCPEMESDQVGLVLL